VRGRLVYSVFLGGGTSSLFAPLLGPPLTRRTRGHLGPEYAVFTALDRCAHMRAFMAKKLRCRPALREDRIPHGNWSFAKLRLSKPSEGDGILHADYVKTVAVCADKRSLREWHGYAACLSDDGVPRGEGMCISDVQRGDPGNLPLTSLMSSKRSFSTSVSAKNPMPRLEEILDV